MKNIDSLYGSDCDRLGVSVEHSNYHDSHMYFHRKI